MQKTYRYIQPFKFYMILAAIIVLLTSVSIFGETLNHFSDPQTIQYLFVQLNPNQTAPSEKTRSPAPEKNSAVPDPSSKSEVHPVKVDPFVPLIKDSEPSSPQANDVKTECIGHSPLEQYDVSQLKLAGVVHRPSGSSAIVENAAGKGYVITKGSPIGIHCGKVTEILEDKIIIQEKDGGSLRSIELKLQKPQKEENIIKKN